MVRAMKNQVIEGNFGNPKTTVMTKVNHSRKANDELRGRRNPQPQEVERICKAIRAGSRYPDRDELLILKARGVTWNPHALRHACGTDLIDRELIFELSKFTLVIRTSKKLLNICMKAVSSKQ